MPKGQLNDYADLLGQAYCKQLVDERKTTTFPLTFVTPQYRGLPCYRKIDETDCWLFVGRLLPEGYAQIKRRTRHQIEKGEVGKNIGVNFLFHRVAFDEDIGPNNSRKGCVGVIKCPVHRNIIVNLCSHTPPCIRPSPPEVRCCLSPLRRSTPPPGPFASPAGPLASSSPGRFGLPLVGMEISMPSGVSFAPPLAPPLRAPAPAESAQSPPSGGDSEMALTPPGPGRVRRSPSPSPSSFASSLPAPPPAVPAQSPPLGGDSEMTLSSTPVRGPFRRVAPPAPPAALANFDNVAPSSLPGADDLALLSSGNEYDDLDNFVVDDDVVEYETQRPGDFPSDF